jgi:hypothetical protein
MKQVAIIVKDDVTELNKRLSIGYQVSSNYGLADGSYMFIMYKYETRELSISETAPTRAGGYLTITQTEG